MIFPSEVLELIANNSLASISSASTWDRCLSHYYENCVHKNMGIIAINNTIDAYTLVNNDSNYYTNNYSTNYANESGLDEYIAKGAIIYKKKWMNGYIPKFNALRAPDDSNLLVINTVFSNADAHYLRFITQKFLENYQAVLITVISDKPYSDILEFVLSNVAKSLSTRNLPVSVIFQTKRNYISKLYFKNLQIFLPKHLLIELHVFGNNDENAPVSSIDMELIFQNTFFYDIEQIFGLQIGSSSLIKDSPFNNGVQKCLHSDQLQTIENFNLVFETENCKADLNVLFGKVRSLKSIKRLHMSESCSLNKKKVNTFGNYSNKTMDSLTGWNNVQDKNGYTSSLKSSDNLHLSCDHQLESRNTISSDQRKKVILPPCKKVELNVGDLRDNLFIDGSRITHELILRNNKLNTSPSLFLNSSVAKPTQRDNLAHSNIETVDIANCYFPNIKKLSILQLYYTKSFYSANTVVIYENNNFVNVESLQINSPMMEKILDIQLPSLKNIHLQFHSFANLAITLQKLYQFSYLEKLTIETNKYTIFDSNFNDNDEIRHLSNCSVILSYMKLKEIVILIKSTTDYEFFFHGLDLTKWSKSDTVVNVKFDPELFESDALKLKMMNATKRVSKNCNLKISAITSADSSSSSTTSSTPSFASSTSSASSTNSASSQSCLSSLKYDDASPTQKGGLIFSRTSSTNIPSFYKESTIVVEGISSRHTETKAPKANFQNEDNTVSTFGGPKETSFTNIYNTPQLSNVNMPVNPSAFSKLFHSGVEASSARKLSVVDIAPTYTWERPYSESSSTATWLNYANDNTRAVPRNFAQMADSMQRSSSLSTENPLSEPSNKKLKSQISIFESTPLPSFNTDKPQNCKMYLKIQFV